MGKGRHQFHADKDCLGLINFRNKHNPSIGYRDQRDIQREFYDLDGAGGLMNDKNLNMLIRTKNTFQQLSDDASEGGSPGPHLFIIGFPLSNDLSMCYSMSADSEERSLGDGFQFADITYDCKTLERHPDGTGYFCDWSPLEMRIVGIENKVKDKTDYWREGNQKHLKIMDDIIAKTMALKTKLKLGDIDEVGYRIQLTAEIVRLYRDTKKWAESL